ncbi:MAG: hypothetical protein RR252_05655 [Longicatena sp.]
MDITTYAKRIQNETSILTFEIMSDIHNTSPFTNKALGMALEDAYSRRIRTMAFLGDFANNGYHFQLTSCFNEKQGEVPHFNAT